jgi:hypothetical protein
MMNPLIKQEHLDFLDGLRESGRTNMYRAGKYVRNYFSVSEHLTKDIWSYWMENFDANGTKIRAEDL